VQYQPFFVVIKTLLWGKKRHTIDFKSESMTATKMKNATFFLHKRLILVGFACCLLAMSLSHAQKGREVSFSKQILTNQFFSEGVAVGDVNKDGKKDVMVGAYWFEAPHWTRHEIAKGDTFTVNGGYSDSFLNFSMDVNQDGWIDLIRLDTPGAAAVWYENPKNKKGHWKSCVIHKSLGNESPYFGDIDGDGRPDLVGNDPDAKQVIWLRAPTKKGETQWERYVIDEGDIFGIHKYTHGLGIEDMNGDGRLDVLTKEGWWEAPLDRKQSKWPFHKANLGEDCSQMYAIDLNQDGLKDIVSMSAHKYGMWWHEERKDAQGKDNWTKHDIGKLFSQTHGLALVDINGDGQKDLVTGKRYFAHNGKDPGALEPAVLYWFELKAGKNPTWIPHEIDNNSGVGLHVVVEDMNNDRLPDIVVANKKGVHVFLQKR